jgi:hypothetical protein
MKKIFILAFLLLSGCNDMPRWETDQELRAKLFQECLKAVPKGPDSVVSNDWAEVVDSCENAAYYQSQRKVGGKS